VRILLIVYDNGSYIHDFPIGLGYIAAVLLREGIEVTIYNQDIHHYTEEHLTEYLDNNRFDAVGVSIIGGYYQYRKLLKLSRAINRSRQRPFYIIGGHGPSPEPKYFLKKTRADAVVIGEGEITIINLLSAIGCHNPLSAVKGIAYRDGESVVVNERQPLIEDIDTIPLPAYHLFPMDVYRLVRHPHARNTDFAMNMLTGRGCPFHCNFCYRMDEGFRPRGNKAIIEEIRFLKDKYRISYILFHDDLLMSSIARTESLCLDLIKSGLKITWGCNGRLNYARPNLLKLMKEAGCVFVNYGIEAMDDQILKNMNKALTTKQIIKGIEASIDAGISPGYNIIFGNIEEDKRTLKQGVEFLLKYDDGVQLRNIRPVTPYPGSDLYYHAIDKGLLKDCQDFYENKHLNSDLMAVNFTKLSDDEFYDGLLNANTRLLKNYFNKKVTKTLEQMEQLYKDKDPNFRGFRHF